MKIYCNAECEYNKGCCRHPENLNMGCYGGIDRCYVDKCDLLKAPTADVVEVRHGRWTLHKDGSGTCSECKKTQKNVWDYNSWQNYCGHCGARMDGDEDGVVCHDWYFCTKPLSKENVESKLGK
jgi:hypothetical protein